MPLVPHVSPNTTITSAWGNLVADHVVMRFATAAQRASQLPAPLTNQMTTRDDRPGVIERWNGSAWVDLGATERFSSASFGGGVYAGTPQEISLTTFTMPFAGVIVAQGIVRWDPTAGAPTTVMNALVDVGPTSTPPAASGFQWVGSPGPANTYYASVPFLWKWTGVAAGVAVNLKMKVSVNAASANLTHVASTVRLIPSEF